MPASFTRGAIATVTFAAALSASPATGSWSPGKPITSDEGSLMRYKLDLLGASLYVILPADDAIAPRAAHLVTRTELRSSNRHWLYYAQETCRWDVRAKAWTDVVVGGRVPATIPSTSWADDVTVDTAEPDAPSALDAQLLDVASAPELLTLFDDDRETRAAILPAPQMVSDETGFCAPPAAEGDNGMVGSVTLVSQVDEGHRVVDLTEAAEALYEAIAMEAIVGTRAVAEMVDVDGMALGDVTLEQTPSGVLIGVALRGLEPGARGIHLHRVGSCTPDFKAASGHVNPRGAAHGLRHPDGPDNGDLPLLHVAVDGSADAEFYTTRVSLSSDSHARAAGLLDDDGSAVIIHAEPDDHLTQPIGGAGSRIACGVIRSI
ncbi:MAG: superoxide dismutase family protein [Gammaproteobacteria bacterium]|nr:superoxide dismutase family protein [Gammaproteobacteria bacterium]